MGHTCNPKQQEEEGGGQCGLYSEILTKKIWKKKGRERRKKANRHGFRSTVYE